jgi:putative PIG3 family NAD(P)H quinone oxidoreductase
MTAIEITRPGAPEVLVPAQRPVPVPGAGEILLRVAAAGVNRPDAMQRRGHYAPPAGVTDIPGLEIAGTIVARGAGADRYAVGAEVCALVPGGGYAEYCIAHESIALPVPAAIGAVAAAAIPETFFTVWSNVFERGRLQAGETLLVHGGSSGIGTVAIMLGKAFGATVITTVGSEQKRRACLDLGADCAINYHSEDFVAATLAATGGKGADVILDMVAGDYVERNYAAAAMDARIVQIATLHGPAQTLSLLPLITKRIIHTGSALRPRPVAEKAGIAAALQRQVWPLLTTGAVKPLIYRTFPLAEAAAAHALLESSEHIGKIVLIC